MIWKGFIRTLCISNTKSLSLEVQNIRRRLKLAFEGQTDGHDKNSMPGPGSLDPGRGHKRVGKNKSNIEASHSNLVAINFIIMCSSQGRDKRTDNVKQTDGPRGLYMCVPLRLSYFILLIEHHHYYFHQQSTRRRTTCSGGTGRGYTAVTTWSGSWTAWVSTPPRRTLRTSQRQWLKKVRILTTGRKVKPRS